MLSVARRQTFQLPFHVGFLWLIAWRAIKGVESLKFSFQEGQPSHRVRAVHTGSTPVFKYLFTRRYCAIEASHCSRRIVVLCRKLLLALRCRHPFAAFSDRRLPTAEPPPTARTPPYRRTDTRWRVWFALWYAYGRRSTRAALARALEVVLLVQRGSIRL
jgi:hypothetical protein